MLKYRFYILFFILKKKKYLKINSVKTFVSSLFVPFLSLSYNMYDMDSEPSPDSSFHKKRVPSPKPWNGFITKLFLGI